MEFYPERVTEFRLGLGARGFERIDIGGLEAWVGTVRVTWPDLATAKTHPTDHRVRVIMWPGFPLRKPDVQPLDESAEYVEARHRAPVDGGFLCLWPDTDRRVTGRAWHPSVTADELLDRVESWFRHSHLDEWKPEDRPPDLHLHFPRADEKELMLTSDDWSPPEGETGRFGVWGRGSSRYAFAGHPVIQGAEVAKAHPDRVLRVLSIDTDRFLRAGVWFRLLREPRPRHSLRALLEEIDAASGHGNGWALQQLRRLLNKAPYRSLKIVLGLGYPSPNGVGESWLFLRIEPPGRKRISLIRPDGLERFPVYAYETAPCGAWDLMRRTGHIAERISGKSVLLLGAGAVGGSIALLLAKAGVQALRVSDGDHLRPTNAVRHVADLWMIGYPKAVALRSSILNHVPDCRVETEDYAWDPDTLVGWMREADIIVDATANEGFSLLVNEIALRQGTPVVYTFTRRRAAVGEVLVVRPGVDPCLVCHTALQHQAAYPLVPPGEEGEFVETGCGVPTVQASAVDVEAAAVLAARVALRLLRAEQGERNHYVLVNEPLPDGGDILHQEGLHTFSWSRTSCEACRQALIP